MMLIARLSWVAIVSLLLVGNVMAVEEAKYTVLREEAPFELRKYDAHIVAETTVDGDFKDAGSKAFGSLFKYISGNNKQQRKIAMTSPVGQEPSNQKIQMTSPVSQQKQDGKWVVSFMMPASFTLETTPVPTDSAISIRRVPERYMAAVQYSGFWSEKGYQQNLVKLQNWTKGDGLNVIGEPQWARYNPPFMPWFLRRNEILLPVAAPQAGN